MVCQYQHWIVLYLDGGLEADQQEELETHLKGCPNCMKDFKVQKKLQQILASLDTVVGVHERLAADPRWRQAFRTRRPYQHPAWKIHRKGKVSDTEKS